MNWTGSLPLALLALDLSCRTQPSSACREFAAQVPWRLQALSEEAGLKLSGTVHGPPSGLRFVGTAFSREGTGEPLDYPIDSLRIAGDSISFRFAPLGIEIRGRCSTSSTVAITFSEPQPPFKPITGRGTLTR